jgi:thiol-disulfide isomerase/thioredoxin
MKKWFLTLTILMILILVGACKQESPSFFLLSPGDTETSVRGTIYLKTELDGVEVTWASSESSVISVTGAVSRPEVDQEAVTVKLTATHQEKSYEFTFVVLPKTGDPILDDYPGLNDPSHIIEEIDYTRLIELLESKEEALIYLGFDSCPWCKEYLPIFHRMAKNLGFEKIYAYDFRSIRTLINNNSALNPEFQAVVDLIGTSWITTRNATNPELPWLFAPTFIGLAGGEVKGLFTGAYGTHVARENYLTADQLEGLRTIFSQMFQEIRSTDPNCEC